MSILQGPGDEPKYKVELQPAEGAVQVSDGTVNVLVSLTSAVMREPAGTWKLLLSPTSTRQFHSPVLCPTSRYCATREVDLVSRDLPHVNNIAEIAGRCHRRNHNSTKLSEYMLIKCNMYFI